jgi:hypothetical protein
MTQIQKPTKRATLINFSWCNHTKGQGFPLTNMLAVQQLAVCNCL